MDYELIKPDEQDAYDPTPFFSYARLRSADKAERDPVVGDTVHFWTTSFYGCRAAIVIDSHFPVDPGYDSAEDLYVFPNAAVLRSDVLPEHAKAPYVQQLVVHNESKPEATSGHELHNGTWHWACGGQ